MYALLLFAMAIAPALAIVLYIFFKDQHEKEPIHLLVKCFLLGALVPVFVLLADAVLKPLGEAYLPNNQAL